MGMGIHQTTKSSDAATPVAAMWTQTHAARRMGIARAMSVLTITSKNLMLLRSCVRIPFATILTTESVALRRANAPHSAVLVDLPTLKMPQTCGA
jgi:hypothetical protein